MLGCTLEINFVCIFAQA